MSRPPDAEAPRSEQVRVRFTPDELAALDATAARLGLSRSETVRELVRLGRRLAGRLPPARRG